MLLRISEVAKQLDISVSSVYQLTYSGELPVVQLRKGCAKRIKSEDVEKYIEACYSGEQTSS